MTSLARAHGARPGPVRVVVREPRELEAIARENAVEGLVREAYGARALLFNYVAGRYDLRALPAALERGPLTQAVFLGWQLAAVRDALSARFGQCVQRPAAVPA